MNLTRKRSPAGRVRLFLLLLCPFLVWTAAYGGEQPVSGTIAAAQVLILNSYHPGNVWSDDEQAAIVHELKKNGLIKLPIIEYLDYKRQPGGRHRAELQVLFRKKYQGKELSAVVAMDEPALEFAVGNHRDIFGDAPVVFCGVNDYKESMLRGDRRVTGVVDTPDYGGTVESMLRLHPGTQEILVLHDYTASGLALRKDFEAVAVPRFAGKIRFRFIANLPVEEIYRELERLPRNALGFLLNFTKDKQGRIFHVSEVVRSFSEHSGVPLYDRSATRLGYGIMGGKLLSPQAVGAATAGLVVRILRGEDVSAIPVVFKDNSQYMFDYRQLERFHIPLSSLPPDSTVINRPVSFYAAYRLLVWGVAVALGVLCLVILLQAIHIQQRRRAEKALATAERRFRDLLENIQLVAVMLDLDGNITFCNDYLLRLTGWSRAEVLRKSWFDLFLPAEERETVREVFTRRLAGTAIPAHHENPILTRAGQQRIIVWDNAALHDAGGQVSGTASIGIDVTDHRKLEEQLLQSQKMEAVGILAGGVAHDFNNILTAILGYASLIRMQAKEDEQPGRLAAKIVDSVDRATELTKSLLAFSRKQTVNMKPVSLNDAVRGFETILSRLIGEDIEVTVHLAAGNPVVEADRGQLEQVLMNLTTNARDAMPQGGRFSIATEEVRIGAEEIGGSDMLPGRYGLITVSDSGTGMDKQIQSHIFEPFFTTKEVGKGTGLGLSMVYGIIKKHSGFIHVYSAPREGTTFRIYLPLIEAQIQEEPARTGGDEIIPRGTETLLLVEDDEIVRHMTAMLLKNSGYQVREAADGEAAVSVFRNHRDEIQLIITDVIMPKKNGRDMYEDIKRIKVGVPVIFMSGYAADIMSGKIFQDDKVHYLSKPMKPAELFQAIRKML